ncbi:putative FAD-linked sulfhydryl oxidase [Symbiodinium microadriaticum]|uniref:Sulfhydryl oxidase n=1 Tax=Symbiodinium microadriaticum TaxID=2951 RepID=A0A1Q9ENP7_SYMMI|nr:putative FAD-linked sulfhydryl oxidase [Symbiodinium microadriaticum]
MVYFFHDLFTNFGHDAAGLVVQALPFAGKLSCFHGLKVSSVASSALGRGMDAPLATQLAMPGHAEGPALAAKLLQGGVSGSCGAVRSILHTGLLPVNCGSTCGTGLRLVCVAALTSDGSAMSASISHIPDVDISCCGTSSHVEAKGFFASAMLAAAFALARRRCRFARRLASLTSRSFSSSSSWDSREPRGTSGTVAGVATAAGTGCVSTWVTAAAIAAMVLLGAFAWHAAFTAALSSAVPEAMTRAPMDKVALNVQTAIQVKEREMKQAKKYRTAKQAKMEILSKLAQKEIHKAERQGHAERIPDVVVQVQEGDAAEDQEIDVDKLIEDELAPSSWGPAMWKSLHCMVHSMPASLPPEQQHSFEAMMNSLPSALPCNSCGEHLQQHLHDDPVAPYLGTRDSLERWLVRLHNTVNHETGKAVVPEPEALANIDKMCACTNSAASGVPQAVSSASAAAAAPLALLAPCFGSRRTESTQSSTEDSVSPCSVRDFL